MEGDEGFMKELLEKSIQFGVGLFAFSKEKVEEFVDDMVGRGEIASKDARQFANDLVKKGEEQKKAVEGLIRNEVSKALDSLSIARKEDMVSRDDIKDIVREVLAESFKIDKKTD